MMQKIRLNWLYFLVLLSILPAFSTWGSGLSVEDMMESANQAYSSGRYQLAIEQYRTLIGENGLSADILYNLGNSYAQNSQNGMAILQYLRALRLSPGDPDIHGNLELVRKEAGLFEEQPSFNDRFWNHYDINQWSLIALAALVGFSLVLAAGFRFQNSKGAKAGCTALFFLFALSCFGTFRQYQLWDSDVIVRPETRLLISPFETASSLGVIQEGSLVFREKRHGRYYYIHDINGRSGWVAQSSLLPVTVSQVTFRPEDAVQ